MQDGATVEELLAWLREVASRTPAFPTSAPAASGRHAARAAKLWSLADALCEWPQQPLLADELYVLSRILYKHRNQHRRALHYSHLRALHRLCDLLRAHVRAAAKSLRALAHRPADAGAASCALWCTWGAHALAERAAAESLQAAQALVGLMAHAFFIPLCVVGTCTAARLRALVQQAGAALAEAHAAARAACVDWGLVPEARRGDPELPVPLDVIKTSSSAGSAGGAQAQGKKKKKKRNAGDDDLGESVDISDLAGLMPAAPEAKATAPTAPPSAAAQQKPKKQAQQQQQQQQQQQTPSKTAVAAQAPAVQAPQQPQKKAVDMFSLLTSKKRSAPVPLPVAKKPEEPSAPEAVAQPPPAKKKKRS
eukprot:m51a1_g11745 hypothetical protein (366) ;mRNA; f:159247-160344